jgi:hypothetical protein
LAASSPNALSLDPLEDEEDWEPDQPSPEDGGGDDIEARFQDVLRRQADLSSSIDRLRSAVTASPRREIGPGHNKGPPLIEELDAVSTHLLDLLQDRGPRPPPIDRVPIVEQAQRTLWLSARIKVWLGVLAIEGAKLGADEVAKHLTEPLWADVADKITGLCHAIVVWISLLPPM